MSLDMWEATTRILDDFAEDDEVRVVVLTGAGGKAFVSGADISQIRQRARHRSRRSRTYDVKTDARLQRHLRIPQADDRDDPRLLHRRRRSASRPAATCASAPTIRKFAVPAAKLGLGYGYAGLKRLVDLVGPSFAKEIFYTARQFDAAGGLCHGPRQPRRAAGRARRLREEHHRHDLRQRAAHHQGGRSSPSAKSSRTNRSATSRASTRWSRPASPAATTSKAAPLSWRSASRHLPAPESSNRNEPRA